MTTNATDTPPPRPRSIPAREVLADAGTSYPAPTVPRSHSPDTPPLLRPPPPSPCPAAAPRPRRRSLPIASIVRLLNLDPFNPMRRAAHPYTSLRRPQRSG